MEPASLSLRSLEALRQKVQPQLNPDADRRSYDVIVIGVGSMGSSACYHLARQGLEVLGLEQFDLAHEQGAHTGQSRIIRKAYFEHPDYVPLLERAYANWYALEAESGIQLFFKNGLLYFGPKDHLLISGTLNSASTYELEVQEFDRSHQQRNYPIFDVPDDYVQLFEPDAGFLTPERAILTYVDQAIQHGAAIQTNEKVLEWKRTQGELIVRTENGTYSCKKLVLTSGAWTSGLTTLDQLTVTRQTIAWAEPKSSTAYDWRQLPCWTFAEPNVDGMYYGFPMLSTATFGGAAGLKVAHHVKGLVTDPDQVDRAVCREEEQQLAAAIQRIMPDGVKRITSLKTCLYTYSPDDHFIIDRYKEQDDVVIAAGFSGHGFKFASVVGEVLMELVMQGKSSLPIQFLKADRVM